MLSASNKSRSDQGIDSSLRVKLKAHAINIVEGAIELIENGYTSSLAPANRSAWELINRQSDCLPQVDVLLGDIPEGSKRHQALLELIVDPQTCGPLLVSCSPKTATIFLQEGHWHEIGAVH